MSEQKPIAEELTTAMHGELLVSEQSDRRFVVFAALDCIEDKSMNEEEALQAYELTKDELELHKQEYYSLI